MLRYSLDNLLKLSRRQCKFNTWLSRDREIFLRRSQFDVDGCWKVTMIMMMYLPNVLKIVLTCRMFLIQARILHCFQRVGLRRLEVLHLHHEDDRDEEEATKKVISLHQTLNHGSCLAMPPECGTF